MNKRQRVIQAVNHQQTETVPYQISLTKEAEEKVIDHVGNQEYLKTIGNHITGYQPGYFEEIKTDHFQDHFGVVWNRTVDKSIGIVEEYILQEKDLSDYKFPDPEEVVDREKMEKLEAEEEKFRSFMIGFSMFERAWSLLGMEQLLTDMLLNPDKVNKLFDEILEYNLKLIDIGIEYDIDAVYFGDDWGEQNSLIMGAKLWKKFIKPRMAKMYEKAKSGGNYIVQHSCGAVQELFPDLIDIGLDIFNTFQPEIMDPQEMKQKFGDKLTFYGGISTQQVLPFVKPQELREEIRRMISIVGENGGYILAPTHAIPKDVPVENILTFIDLAQNQ